MNLSIDAFTMSSAHKSAETSDDAGLFADVDHGGSKLRRQLIELYESVRPGLFAYLVSLGLDRNTAEDVIQETFLKLIQHVLKRKHDSDLRGWLFRVAHNLTMNLHGSAYRRLSDSMSGEKVELLQFVDSALSPEDVVIRKQDVQRLKTAMDRLTEQQRWAVLLRAEGLSYREIAETLGVSTQRIADLVQRALQRLSGDL